MKNKLLLTLIILIFTHTAVAQRNSVYFKNEIFSGLYSEVYQQPLTITYNDNTEYKIKEEVDDTVLLQTTYQELARILLTNENTKVIRS